MLALLALNVFRDRNQIPPAQQIIAVLRAS
jgi:hypothetical protein